MAVALISGVSRSVLPVESSASLQLGIPRAIPQYRHVEVGFVSQDIEQGRLDFPKVPYLSTEIHLYKELRGIHHED